VARTAPGTNRRGPLRRSGGCPKSNGEIRGCVMAGWNAYQNGMLDSSSSSACGCSLAMIAWADSCGAFWYLLKSNAGLPVAAASASIQPARPIRPPRPLLRGLELQCLHASPFLSVPGRSIFGSLSQPGPDCSAPVFPVWQTGLSAGCANWSDVVRSIWVVLPVLARWSGVAFAFACCKIANAFGSYLTQNASTTAPRKNR